MIVRILPRVMPSIERKQTYNASSRLNGVFGRASFTVGSTSFLHFPHQARCRKYFALNANPFWIPVIMRSRKDFLCFTFLPQQGQTFNLSETLWCISSGDFLLAPSCPSFLPGFPRDLLPPILLRCTPCMLDGVCAFSYWTSRASSSATRFSSSG